MNFQMPLNPFFLTDFYKVVHHHAYKPGLEKLTSYWTPRMSRIEGLNEVVVFGVQGFIKEYLIDYFNTNFFSKSRESVVSEFKHFISCTMPDQTIAQDTTFIEALHDLGYLPIEIKALPEGTVASIKVPSVEISSTHPNFPWLVNYFETLFSSEIWQCMTSATLAMRYKALVNHYHEKTVDALVGPAPEYLCGDFSMRGMGGIHSASLSGTGHLTSFKSSATIPAIARLLAYYNCDLNQDEVGFGVASMEHSVMSSYGEADELEAYNHLITEVFPTGKLSIVSDTYNYWRLIVEVLPQLKTEILAREGKILIRGDSGDPVDIICGNPNAEVGTPAYYGTVELLYRIFGGSVNIKGYKVLDQHIGAIYGDSITYERAEEIYKRLEAKGFAISNCILGIGSYTYQYNTRDTFGFALKATQACINGVETPIFKNPLTDDGHFKKSHKGICVVVQTPTGCEVIDECTHESAAQYENMLQPIFRDGKMIKETSLTEIRTRLSDYLNRRGFYESNNHE